MMVSTPPSDRRTPAQQQSTRGDDSPRLWPEKHVNSTLPCCSSTADSTRDGGGAPAVQNGLSGDCAALAQEQVQHQSQMQTQQQQGTGGRPLTAFRYTRRSRDTRRALRKRLQQKREWGAVVAQEAAVMQALTHQVVALEAQQGALQQRLSRAQSACCEMRVALADTLQLLAQQDALHE